MFYISSDNLWPIRCFHTESQGVYHNITSYIIIQVIITCLVNSYTIQLIYLFWEVLGRLGFAAMLGRSQHLLSGELQNRFQTKEIAFVVSMEQALLDAVHNNYPVT